MDLNHPLLAAGALDDPPPFPANQTQLQRLDRALLCQICKEPFQGPVSINCGHSFCSQCIRSSLDTLKKCPSCGEPASEGGIRRNRALEEMVDAWEDARPVMINLSKPAPPKRRAEGNGHNPRVKRLRLSDAGASNGHGQTAGGSRSRSTSERPVSRASGSASPEKEESGAGFSASGAIELGSSDAEEEEFDGEGAEVEVEEVDELSETDEGECPLCQARLPIASIPAHIERNCEPPRTRKTGVGLGGVQGSGNAKADWKKVFGGVSAGGAKGAKEAPMKRLTKFNFSLSQPSALRAFLTTHSLPTTGDRPQLEARVSEWILLYNSNLDTSHPRSLAALRAKLTENEASRKRDREKGKDALGEKLGTKSGMAEYARERKGEFERLRELAGRGRNAGKGQGQGQEREEGRGGSEGAAIVVD